MPNIKELLCLQKAKIEELCVLNFIEKGNAFYHPVTEKLSFITDGYCIKGECSNRKQNICPERKILLPPHLRFDFRTTEGGVCALPESKIGEVVICLSHFFIEHQVAYLEDGCLPPGSRLMGKSETTHKEGDPIPPASESQLRDPHKGLDAWRGYKIAMTKGLKNNDWVISLVNYRALKSIQKVLKSSFK
jgi:hypothetical protein